MHDSLIHLLIHSPDPEVRRATLVALVKALATRVTTSDTRVDTVADMSNLIRDIQEAP